MKGNKHTHTHTHATVPNFNQFEELQFLEPNLPKKHFRLGVLGQIQPENNLSQLKKYFNMAAFRWFQVVLAGSSWFQVAPCFMTGFRLFQMVSGSFWEVINGFS